MIFDGKRRPTRIYDRDALTPGKNYSGPAIVTEYSATTVIPPAMSFHRDHAGNLQIAIRAPLPKTPPSNAPRPASSLALSFHLQHPFFA